MIKPVLLLLVTALFPFSSAITQILQQPKTVITEEQGSTLALVKDPLRLNTVTDLNQPSQRWKNDSNANLWPIQGDTITHMFKNASKMSTNSPYKLRYTNFIVPTVFIGFGVASLSSDALKKLNSSTKDEIAEHRLSHMKLDNYSQYVPALMVYGLNAFGVKGKHNFRDRTVIYLTSQLISGAMVIPLKHLVKEVRPDSSDALSFPSGHTATAFSSAQFMYHEYRDSNFWLSISGYPFAIFTGIYRTINNRHWVGDVVAGAGFGILSTELAYWLHPKINQLLFKDKPNTSSMVMPFYQNRQFGLSYARQF
ncbi:MULTISPECIES: phosphatase PAP2 family protein [Sphingobacterium]|uniref:Phosphatase PAP2 family protein n=1 Tax=Sphingobacterium ginsenosidimutans TaxID=687845 RepID=A0ABP7ZXM5_9SPHI|nr:phosphatase PAP2 family protein [Sphingobacterium sp. E70]ULT23162.1 phosphatase PAP2 family protein [Sphingobacterium sp. E70]